MKKYMLFPLLVFMFIFTMTAQANKHYDENVNVLYEVENILELIAGLDANVDIKATQRELRKQRLKNLAIHKIRSI